MEKAGAQPPGWDAPSSEGEPQGEWDPELGVPRPPTPEYRRERRGSCDSTSSQDSLGSGSASSSSGSEMLTARERTAESEKIRHLAFLAATNRTLETGTWQSRQQDEAPAAELPASSTERRADRNLSQQIVGQAVQGATAKYEAGTQPAWTTTRDLRPRHSAAFTGTPPINVDVGSVPIPHGDVTLHSQERQSPQFLQAMSDGYDIRGRSGVGMFPGHSHAGVYGGGSNSGSGPGTTLAIDAMTHV